MKIKGTPYTLSSHYQLTEQKIVFDVRKKKNDSIDHISVNSLHAKTASLKSSYIQGDTEAEYINNLFRRAVEKMGGTEKLYNYNYSEKVNKVIAEEMAALVEADMREGKYKGA